jgi:RNA polymerase sigma-70 factor (ECF subfamily)
VVFHVAQWVHHSGMVDSWIPSRGVPHRRLTYSAAEGIILLILRIPEWHSGNYCGKGWSRGLRAIRNGALMSQSSDDARLIARAQEGEPAAVAEIYERHHAAIYRYVFYRVGDVPTAEDLTGTVFVRVVENIDRFVYRGRPLLTWLYTIARNVVVDHHRRTGGPAIVPLEERLVNGAADVERAAERALTQQRLARALSRLTEDQRQVIVLKFIEEMSNEEAAATMAKTVGAVKSLQHRALASLQRILAEGSV